MMAEKITRLKLSQVETAIEWAANEGWNPGLKDGEAFFNTDPQGFWGAIDRSGLAAVISAVQYSADFGFVGFYICRPDRRGQGLGYRLWQHALEACTAQTIGLDGVIDQQENYRKSGFVFAHRNLRYSGVIKAQMPKDDMLFTLERGDIAILDAFEQSLGLFPESRIDFLRGWISTPGHIGLALRGPMGVRAYGVIRPCRTGHKIGPLFAQNDADARLLFDALLASREDQGTPVYLDIPEPNEAARQLVDDHKMTCEFETARMYRGEAPTLDLSKIFGITTFELG